MKVHLFEFDSNKCIADIVSSLPECVRLPVNHVASRVCIFWVAGITQGQNPISRVYISLPRIEVLLWWRPTGDICRNAATDGRIEAYLLQNRIMTSYELVADIAV